MLVEMIFRGSFTTLNLILIKKLLYKAKETRFNFPENKEAGNIEVVIETISSHDYVDLVINTDNFEIEEKIVPKVFMNLGRDGENTELLLYFDLIDLKYVNLKTSIDFLERWAYNFKDSYNLDYFICQTDNANKDEYYFDSNGQGSFTI